MQRLQVEVLDMANVSKLARYEMMRRGEAGMESRQGRMYEGGNMNATGGRMYGDMEMRGAYDNMETGAHWDRREVQDPGYVPEQRRGQPRRRDGTYAPKNEMEPPYIARMREPEEPMERERKANIIGFADRTRSGAEHQKLTAEKAKEWVRKMHSKSAGSGEHWNMEQVKRIMAEQGVEHDPVEVYAIMNAIYSDYCKVLMKYGLNSPQVVLDFAEAWLEDDDAVENKAAAYYECVVKR